MYYTAKSQPNCGVRRQAMCRNRDRGHARRSLRRHVDSTRALSHLGGRDDDASPFVASDGSVYLTYSDDVGIRAQRLSSNGLSLAGGEQLLMRFNTGYPWEFPRIEGPTMLTAHRRGNCAPLLRRASSTTRSTRWARRAATPRSDRVATSTRRPYSPPGRAACSAPGARRPSNFPTGRGGSRSTPGPRWWDTRTAGSAPFASCRWRSPAATPPSADRPGLGAGVDDEVVYQKAAELRDGRDRFLAQEVADLMLESDVGGVLDSLHRLVAQGRLRASRSRDDLECVSRRGGIRGLSVPGRRGRVGGAVAGRADRGYRWRRPTRSMPTAWTSRVVIVTGAASGIGAADVRGARRRGRDRDLRRRQRRRAGRHRRGGGGRRRQGGGGSRRCHRPRRRS